jgi:hypothetical protein
MATISSGYTTSEPILVDNPATWSFTAPENPDIKVVGVTVEQPLSQNIVEAYGVFKPLGASKSVVISQSIYGVDGTYQFTVQGETAWDALYPVLTYQGTLHVHDPLGRQKYVRFVDRNWTESGNINNLIRVIKVTYFEVDAP